MYPFFSALRFLTVLPVPERWCGDQESFLKSPAWYPLVGLFIGLLLALLDFFLGLLLPLPVVSVLLLAAMIAVSGALHLDGLADSADAFFSSRGRERMLEIMKDSRSGPMGVVAIVVVLLLKLILLLSLPLEWRWQTLVLMPVAGRSALTLVSSRLPYARSEGLAGFTGGGSGPTRAAIAVLVPLFASLVLLGGKAGLPLVLLLGLSVWGLGNYCRRKIGGFTGDTLGAICELVELVPALWVVLLAHQGML